jgi:hypothetical protein
VFAQGSGSSAEELEILYAKMKLPAGRKGTYASDPSLLLYRKPHGHND